MIHKMRVAAIRLAALMLLVFAHASAARAADVPRWSVHELTLSASGNYRHPYTETSVTAIFTGPGGLRQTVHGFWNGGNSFVIRFTLTRQSR